MRARHEIRTRVLTADILEEPSNDMVNRPNDSYQEKDETEASLSEIDAPNVPLSGLTDKELNIIRPSLRNIEAGRSSAFSLSTLSSHYAILNRPIPTIYLSEFKIGTLCTSRFGTEHASIVQDYVAALETCTIIEYAAWLGEYKLLAPMLAGGLDPTLRGSLKGQQEAEGAEYESKRLALSSQLLKRFFDAFPRTLSSYIVKRVVDMRRQHWKYVQDIEGCHICGSHDPAQLCFGSTCNHCFCENCFWEDLLNDIDDRDDGDVVLCPVCGASESSDENATQDNSDLVLEHHSSSELRLMSLRKYQALPATSRELKKLSKQNKHRKKALSASWSEAVMQSVGSSQDVRRDKFFSYTEQNAYHSVKGCMMAGVDVDLTNEYGQTALHIAAWKGYIKLVALLLKFGADPSIKANGGVSAERASEANGHTAVLAMLRQSEGSSLPSIDYRFPTHDMISKPKAEVLIDSEADHPGAGACIIDECFSSDSLDALISLFQSLPVDQSDAEKRTKKPLCSVRSYYCDSEGYLRKLLTGVICRAFQVDDSCSRVTVFPHMRFLHYLHPGSILAPHVDLFRTDLSGQSSTHTFILYLFDCQSGGETSLLGGLWGDGRNEVLARVSPKRGRLLLFRHACPHEGNEVIDVPKVLLRGEVKIARQCL